ncbi:UNVERIFIED_CONTAM: hypothetical protein Scaly_3038700 [Sesamum calycinum]|uniref:Uncharacterized protein n=1 Tax=Sesamum calycinum TaxID=2727403 RepID=A0AAW2K622_9LAMI
MPFFLNSGVWLHRLRRPPASADGPQPPRSDWKSRISASLYTGTVYIWNYQTQTTDQSFEVTELVKQVLRMVRSAYGMAPLIVTFEFCLDAKYIDKQLVEIDVIYSVVSHRIAVAGNAVTSRKSP